MITLFHSPPPLSSCPFGAAALRGCGRKSWRHLLQCTRSRGRNRGEAPWPLYLSSLIPLSSHLASSLLLINPPPPIGYKTRVSKTGESAREIKRQKRQIARGIREASKEKKEGEGGETLGREWLQFQLLSSKLHFVRVVIFINFSIFEFLLFRSDLILTLPFIWIPSMRLYIYVHNSNSNLFDHLCFLLNNFECIATVIVHIHGR